MKTLTQMKAEVKEWNIENKPAILAARARIKARDHPKFDNSRFALMKELGH